MKTENNNRSARKLCAIIRVVLQQPGMRQKSLCQLTGLNKADVSRLCALGIEEGIIEKKGPEYYEGPVIKENKKSILNLLG